MAQLPFGFDPDTGSFANVTLPPPRVNNRYADTVAQTSSGSSTGYAAPQPRLNLWRRFDRFISRIGNWFADNFDDVVDRLSVILYWIIILVALAVVIMVWVKSGFFYALLTGVGAMIVIGICYFVAEIVLPIITGILMFGGRFIFWNGVTFILFLTVLFGGWAFSAFAPHAGKDRIENVAASATETYTCTASVLNVRSEPNTGGRVLGTLKRGQKAEVQEIRDGFARIEYNGGTGYVAMRYLKPVEEDKKVRTQ